MKKEISPLFVNLMKQAKQTGVKEVLTEQYNKADYDLIVDAIFGFSFKGAIREPYLALIKELKTSGLPICSVDIPSGWNVDTGANADGFE
jgi:NAD(P)H-hydrate epimerase